MLTEYSKCLEADWAKTLMCSTFKILLYFLSLILKQLRENLKLFLGFDLTCISHLKCLMWEKTLATTAQNTNQTELNQNQHGCLMWWMSSQQETCFDTWTQLAKMHLRELHQGWLGVQCFVSRKKGGGGSRWTMPCTMTTFKT